MERSLFSGFLALSLLFSFSTFALAVPADDWQISRNYDDIKLFLRDVAAKYPTTTRIIEVGESDSIARRGAREKIYGLMIANPGTRAAFTPRALVVGTHHGNEYGSTEVAKGVAVSLAETPIPGLITFVVPVLNISGYNIRSRFETLGNDRLDANRDYNGPCGTSGPFKLRSTASLAKFIEGMQISASATLHTFSPAVLYPWGISTHETSTRYNDAFKTLGALAAEFSHYEVGNSTDLLYPADGTFEDYSFWKFGIWSLLFELGNSHTPSPLEVNEMIAVNVPGIRKFLENAPRKVAEVHEFEGKCETTKRGFEKRE